MWSNVYKISIFSSKIQLFRVSVPFPSEKTLNIPGHSKSESDQALRYIDNDVDFESWMSKQTKLKENIRKVCEKYGESLRLEDPLHSITQFLYDSKHKLLFCRNAKVKQLSMESLIPFDLSFSCLKCQK